MRVRSAATDVAQWPLFIQEGSLSLPRLIAMAKLLIRQEHPKLLIVDYAQIWKGEVSDLEGYAQEMREFATRKNWGLQSRDLKTFSVRLAPNNAGIISGQTFVVEAGRN